MNSLTSSQMQARTYPSALLFGTLFAVAVLGHGSVYASDNEEGAFEANFPTASSESRGTSSEIAKLEQAFWFCDYVATIYGPANVDGVECASVTDELKRFKFEGDFEKMLAWWRVNKPAQHAALDRADMALAAGESVDTVEYPDSI